MTCPDRRRTRGRTFDCNQIVTIEVNSIGETCVQRHSTRPGMPTDPPPSAMNRYSRYLGAQHRQGPAQYQPTDCEWPQAPHGVPYRPEM